MNPVARSKTQKFRNDVVDLIAEAQDRAHAEKKPQELHGASDWLKVQHLLSSVKAILDRRLNP